MWTEAIRWTREVGLKPPSESDKPWIDYFSPVPARVVRWGLVAAGNTFFALYYANYFVANEGDPLKQTTEILKAALLIAAMSGLGILAEKAYNNRRNIRR